MYKTLHVYIPHTGAPINTYGYNWYSSNKEHNTIWAIWISLFHIWIIECVTSLPKVYGNSPKRTRFRLLLPRGPNDCINRWINSSIPSTYSLWKFKQLWFEIGFIMAFYFHAFYPIKLIFITYCTPFGVFLWEWFDTPDCFHSNRLLLITIFF